ncbi:MAG: DUF2189 domain-containing protein [Burkholderiaceae bacterium]
MSREAAIRVRTVPLSAPLQWLALGWRDFRSCPGAGLLHGAFVAVGGWVVLALSFKYWWLAPGAFSGFVIVGPILATGLYELSRVIGRGESPGLADAVAAWRRGTWQLVQLGLLLSVLGTLWVVGSAILFRVFVKVPLRGPVDFLRYVAVEQGNVLFLEWAILGGLCVAVVFAITAVSPPLLLGRRVGLAAAMLASVRAVGDNPGPMLVWALVILVATSLSLATAMLGFLVSVPVIGHATWHAYRALIDASELPLRNE